MITLKLLPSRHLIRQQHRLIELQDELLDLQRAQIQNMRLEQTRDLQGIVSAWLIHIEQPELDLRDDLAELEHVLGDQLAVLEEHAP